MITTDTLTDEHLEKNPSSTLLLFLITGVYSAFTHQIHSYKKILIHGGVNIL